MRARRDAEAQMHPVPAQRVAIAADRAEALVQDRSQARGAGSAMDEDPVFA